MSTASTSSTAPTLHRLGTEQIRATFLGSPAALAACMPSATPGMAATPIDCSAGDSAPIEAVQETATDAVVVVDPGSIAVEQLQAIGELRAPTLGVLVDGIPEAAQRQISDAFDRLVGFDPKLTGARVGHQSVWRAVPPPVADDLFADVRPIRQPPRAMSIGRSTGHREAMLMPSKHDHNLLQVVHGLSGEALRETLNAYDVGVYISPEDAPAFDWQVCVHLAAGHLLLAEPLSPAHGLERDIDYLSITSPGDLAWALQRLTQFPDMHRRIRIRGRMKAEHYRASRVFTRLLHDLNVDVATFGRPPGRGGAAGS